MDFSLRFLLNPSNAVFEDMDEPKPTEAMDLMGLDAEEGHAIYVVWLWVTLMRVFETIWDTSIIDHIETETNKDATKLQSRKTLASRISRWNKTTREEIWRFISILML